MAVRAMLHSLSPDRFLENYLRYIKMSYKEVDKDIRVLYSINGEPQNYFDETDERQINWKANDFETRIFFGISAGQRSKLVSLRIPFLALEDSQTVINVGNNVISSVSFTFQYLMSILLVNKFRKYADEKFKTPHVK